MKRLVAALGAAVIGLTVVAAGATTGAQAAPAATPTPLPTFSWSSCGDLECSSFAVPLDWAQPDGEKITLAVTRKKATAAPYRGMMLTNPGGPGASGTSLPVLSDYVPGNAGAHFDWIGFDPRGVGDSTPSLHCNSHYFGVNRPSFTPTTRRLMRFWVGKTTRYARACGRSAAKRILPHVTTRDTVKDMELIRAAYQAQNPLQSVQLEKLNFYGFSYGTYLGQVYAVTYPNRVGRFVLDGLVDPKTYWYRSNLDQEIGFDRNLDVYFKWLAAHPRTFKLGSNWHAIARGFKAQLRKLDRHPAAQGRLGPDELIDAMLSAGYYVYDWDVIGDAYSRLVRQGLGGAMFSLYAASNMGDDNGYAMYVATQCTDALRPPWKRQVADARRINKKHPFLAWDNTWYNAPCRYWPAPARSRIAVNGAQVSAKILMINETLDAATSFAGALSSRSLFPSASLIEGVGGTTHAGSLSGVGCVDNRIAQYLTSGTVPARQPGRRSDVRCPKVSPPPVGSARVAGTTGVPPALRAQLFAGQLG
ncbi:alpha/beta fold hydrolase [Marmoricola sp. RAF53]|uniref:alpha/beta fold hydrolase n=1 Tax=Marmoricola sp. RAF53 TaxID=3233059 RepID=UPI003F983CCF